MDKECNRLCLIQARSGRQLICPAPLLAGTEMPICIYYCVLLRTYCLPSGSAIRAKFQPWGSTAWHAKPIIVRVLRLI